MHLLSDSCCLLTFTLHMSSLPQCSDQGFLFQLISGNQKSEPLRWPILDLCMPEEPHRCYYSKWKYIISGEGKGPEHMIQRYIPYVNYITVGDNLATRHPPY